MRAGRRCRYNQTGRDSLGGLFKGGVDAQRQVGRQAGMQETENGNNHKSDNKAEQNF